MEVENKIQGEKDKKMKLKNKQMKRGTPRRG